MFRDFIGENLHVKTKLKQSLHANDKIKLTFRKDWLHIFKKAMELFVLQTTR